MNDTMKNSSFNSGKLLLTSVDAQITERERPAEWQHLVKGARFMDRFLPMPDGIQIKGIWGTDSVLNRYVDNGIELPGVSFGEEIYCRIRMVNTIVCVWLARGFSERAHVLVEFYCFSCSK